MVLVYMAVLNIQLVRGGEAYLDYRWYSKAGFKPQVGYRHYLPWGTASIGYSKESNEYNDKTVWIEKIGEVRLDTHTYHVGKSPVTVRGGVNVWLLERGFCKRILIKNIMQRFLMIQLNSAKKADLRFLGGYQRDYYGYDGSIRSMPYWGARFQSKVGNRANVWVSYDQRNISYNNSPYRFDNDRAS